VPVEIRSRDGRPYFSQLSAARLPEAGPPPPPTEHLAAMLSLGVDDLLDTEEDGPAAYSCGMPFLYIPLASLEAVERARLNWEWWEQALSAYWAPLIYLFSYECSGDADLHARMFGVGLGIEEDPATGAAASAIAGYLGPRSGNGDGTRRWKIEQGFEMGRPSLIEVEADVKRGKIRAVRVGGTSVMVSTGELEIP
jgi:trans-2,3-dihydro-3-hydroxyanthranilate isomerase